MPVLKRFEEHRPDEGSIIVASRFFRPVKNLLTPPPFESRSIGRFESSSLEERFLKGIVKGGNIYEYTAEGKIIPEEPVVFFEDDGKEVVHKGSIFIGPRPGSTTTTYWNYLMEETPDIQSQVDDLVQQETAKIQQETKERTAKIHHSLNTKKRSNDPEVAERVKHAIDTETLISKKGLHMPNHLLREINSYYGGRRRTRKRMRKRRRTNKV